MSEENLILKLFDMLKDAVKEVSDTLKQLLNNQQSIGEYMKTLPIKELKDSLREHDRDANNNIDSCTETVQLQTSDILKSIQSLKDIIVRSIIIISVFFTLVTSGWFYKSFIQPQSNDDLKGIILNLEKSINEAKEKSTENNKLIEDLRETIRKLTE